MKKKEKDIFRLLSIILGAAIILTACLIAVQLLFAGIGSRISDSLTGGEKTTELTAAVPGEDERTVAESITVYADPDAKEKEAEDENSLSEEYIIADSDTRILTEADIEGMSAKELNYAKNEIYARHGRIFDSEELSRYFESRSWYEGKYEGADFDKNYSTAVLSEIEKKNAEFLKNAEYALADGGYQLDQQGGN